MKKTQKGFTLIEILIVIAIIGILALVVFVALDPAARFADARNSNREQNIDSIGKAVLQYNVDNSGTWPQSSGANIIPYLQNSSSDNNGFNKVSGNPDCTYASVVAGDASVAADVTAGCMWADYSTLSSALTPKYLTSVPVDSGTYSHYFVALTPDGAHVVVMSDSMDTNTISTNPSHIALYYKSY